MTKTIGYAISLLASVLSGIFIGSAVNNGRLGAGVMSGLIAICCAIRFSSIPESKNENSK